MVDQQTAWRTAAPQIIPFEVEFSFIITIAIIISIIIKKYRAIVSTHICVDAIKLI